MDGSPAVTTVTDSNKLGPQPSFDGSVAVWGRIKWQCGPIPEVGVNGLAIEDVIDICLDRLEGFQKGSFNCRENALAITKLQEAQQWLLFRTKKRVAQGVEGSMKSHKS